MKTLSAGSQATLLDSSIAALISGLDPDWRAEERNELSWDRWLRLHFPAATTADFGIRHIRLWEWFESLEPGVKPRARAESWPRGGAKSWTAEAGTVRVGEKLSRRLALYVCSTQAQANKHVAAIGQKFEVLGRGRAVNKYGSSLGWRLDLLRVDNGFNVLALGLDAAGRGIRIEDYRPDLIIFDDIDERHDSEATVQKKRETITESILPAGSVDCAVLFVQNRIHSGSIMSQLVEGTADFLLDRQVFEEKAVEGLQIESEIQEDGTRRYRITEGRATWEGQSLATCQDQLNEWGRAAFLREAQHETDESEDGLWDRSRDIDPFRIGQDGQPPRRPDLYRIAVAIDPNAMGGDDAGIMVGGIYRVNGMIHGVLLEDATVPGGPKVWAQAAVDAYSRHQGDAMVAEQNNGGEMVAITIGTITGAPRVKLLHASRGKLTRAEPVQKLGEDGRIHHDGVFVALEKELCSWQPGEPSPNRLDAYVWLFTELMLTPTAPSSNYSGLTYSGR